MKVKNVIAILVAIIAILSVHQGFVKSTRAKPQPSSQELWERKTSHISFASPRGRIDVNPWVWGEEGFQEGEVVTIVFWRFWNPKKETVIKGVILGETVEREVRHEIDATVHREDGVSLYGEDPDPRSWTWRFVTIKNPKVLKGVIGPGWSIKSIERER